MEVEKQMKNEMECIINNQPVEAIVLEEEEKDLEEDPLKNVDISKELRTKKEYIEQIELVSEKLGKRPPRGYRYFTKAKLKEEMANLISNGIKSTYNAGFDEGKATIDHEAEERKSTYAVNVLYRLNLAFMTITERLTEANKKSLGGYYVKNWSGYFEDSEEKKQQLRDCLRELYEKYKDQVAPYMDPFSIYLLLMTTSAVQCLEKEKIVVKFEKPKESIKI